MERKATGYKYQFSLFASENKSTQFYMGVPRIQTLIR